VAVLTYEQVAALAHTAGFRGDRLVVAVAVAAAESGRDAADVGDEHLVNGTWGPSVGLWQIRSLHKDKGTGRTRDEEANRDPLVNAKAAFAVSDGGRNWSPWTEFKNGGFRAHVVPAGHAVIAIGEAGFSIGDVVREVIANPGAVPGVIVDEVADGWRSVVALLTDPQTWVRVFTLLAGGALVVGGVVILAKDTKMKVVKGAVGSLVES